jgi:predicted CoA-binding protein
MAKKDGEWYRYEKDDNYWRLKLFIDSSGVIKQYQDIGLKGSEAGEGISWNFTFQKIHNISLEKFADSVYEINKALTVLEKVKKERTRNDSAVKEMTQPLTFGMQLPVFNCIENSMIQLDSFDFVLAESWYIQCQPCYKMKKDIEANEREFTNRKIKVLGYNTINDTANIRRFLCNKGYNGYEINTSVFRNEMLNTSSYPTLYLLNRDLKVVKTFEGYNNKRVNEIIEYTDKLRSDE